MKQRRLWPCAGIVPAFVWAFLGLAATQAHACGPNTDCMIGERTYRIALPLKVKADAEAQAPASFGAILFLHGYRGSAAGAMGNAAMRDVAETLGVAFVAAKSGGEDWLIRNAPRKGFEDDSRELAYFDALIDDLAEKGVDRDKIMVTGFSAGGMMTWTLACRRPESFAAFVPVAGTFWAPMPEDCAYAPMTLLHIHGTSDTIVPLGGRPIADVHQGDVPDALAALRDAVGPDDAQEAAAGPAGLDCTGTGPHGEGAAEGAASVTLCLHDGGHIFAADWMGWAYRNLVEGP